MEKNKRDRILDGMQNLINSRDVQLITVDEIAKEAGIGKGSIYYYFSSKSEILKALIARSYGTAVEEGRKLAQNDDLDVFTKLEVLFCTCLTASGELRRGEAESSLSALQESALIHQEFVSFTIRELLPSLSQVLDQGHKEGQLYCPDTESTARIILSILAVHLDNHLAPASPEEIRRLLKAFAWMQEVTMKLPQGKLDFLYREQPDDAAK